jgi:hypothetical protein
MKNILKQSIRGLIAFFFLSFLGCSDFLEYQKYGPGDSESFWKTEGCFL